MSTKTLNRKSKGSPKKNKKPPASKASNPAVPQLPAEKVPKKREPRMTHKQIWLLYAHVAFAQNAEDVFHVLARSFEDHNELGYWLYRVRRSDLKVLRKGHDWIEYLRLVSTRLFRITRNEPI